MGLEFAHEFLFGEDGHTRSAFCRCRPTLFGGVITHKLLPKINYTDRGFGIVSFVDRYKSKCSLQESSIATDACVWLGVVDANPMVLAQDAIRLGRLDLTGDKTTGWVKFPVPEEVSFTTRMHLTQNMVADLLPLLENFVKTGRLK